MYKTFRDKFRRALPSGATGRQGGNSACTRRTIVAPPGFECLADPLPGAGFGLARVPSVRAGAQIAVETRRAGEHAVPRVLLRMRARSRLPSRWRIDFEAPLSLDQGRFVTHFPDTEHRTRRFPMVGIGASAGGLEAISELISALPFPSGMAFLVVQHLDFAAEPACRNPGQPHRDAGG
ncbi:chemotaxis protein CheB [Burkholderia sp. 22PA0099]|uniref:chemotaxis protein CheB n=1 Tax=Burkholderia sp. 22PA0099 TaxID=3237372 RepID=UPI0039C2E4F2